jgi:hypothetical protein
VYRWFSSVGRWSTAMSLPCRVAVRTDRRRADVAERVRWTAHHATSLAEEDGNDENASNPADGMKIELLH